MPPVICQERRDGPPTSPRPEVGGRAMFCAAVDPGVRVSVPWTSRSPSFASLALPDYAPVGMRGVLYTRARPGGRPLLSLAGVTIGLDQEVGGG